MDLSVAIVSAIAIVIAAVLAAVAALVGVWLGGQQQRKAHQEQRQHEERTRFHGDRLEIYVRFLRTITWYRSDVQEGELSDSLNDIGNMVMLIASPEVCQHAISTIACVKELLLARAEGKETVELKQACYSAEEEFVEAARLELGVQGALSPDGRKRKESQSED